MPERVILENPLAPGDILMSSGAIRDLHKAYPGEYLTDIRVPTGAEQIFQHSPYITQIDEKGVVDRRIRLSYEDIHQSGWSGRPFSQAYHLDLAKAIGRPIPPTACRPDIFLSQDETLWPSPVLLSEGYEGAYWIINAGVKNDYTLKYYHRYQEVVDLLKGKVQFVQVGQMAHNHTKLEGAIDMRGKTDIRALFRLSWHAHGAVSPVSFQMVIMGAMEKPCVVVSGAREPIRWQHFPNHRFLALNGSMSCAKWDGCWKNTIKDCVKPVDVAGTKAPLCLEMIRPEDIARAIESYYIGGALKKGD